LQALVALLLLAIALPFIPANLFRARIQRAMEQALGRKVEIGDVHLTLLPGVLPGPGFTLDQVLIHEDERAGIEPFAYVETLGASVRLSSLFRRRLEFSSLNLGDATVNVVKSSAGPWNFQYLLARTSTSALPSLRMRGGRVNFKFTDTKSVFYFNDADLDVSTAADGTFDLRFGGAPSRTDRSATAQDFGRLFVRGSSSDRNQKLNFQVELERSSLEPTLSWMIPGGLGVHGIVALNAQLSGSPSNLAIAGELQVGDVHRWDLLPQQSGTWKIAYTGKLNLSAENLEISTTPSQAPIGFNVRAWAWLSNPGWNADLSVNLVPLDTVIAIARHMGTSLPESVTAEGKVSGGLRYDQEHGLSGDLTLADATLTLPEAQPLRAKSASVVVADGVWKLARSVVETGEDQTAELEGSFGLAEREWDLKITAKGLTVATMRSFKTAAIPVIKEAQKGAWRGWARYKEGTWSGDFEIHDAKLAVDGVSKPVEIDSATIRLNGARVTMNKITGRAGEIEFKGDYRWDPAALRPHRFNLQIADAPGNQLAAMLAPVIERQNGFLARTLRLGAAAPAPKWLADRRAEGMISFDSLDLGETRISRLSARVEWDGLAARIENVKGWLPSGDFAGDIEVDLTPAIPKLHFEGRIDDMAYRGGTIDVEGTADAGGEIGDFLATLRAEGTLRARSIQIAPETEFRTATSAFTMQGFGSESRWKLSNLEVTQGTESYTGSGATQPDGKILLELAGREKQIRYSAAVTNAIE
jgi:hypothetical protein